MDAAVARNLEALSTSDAEARVRQILATCGQNWGCTSEAEFPYAKFMRTVLAGLCAPAVAQAPVDGPPPTDLAPTAHMSTVASGAASMKPAGGPLPAEPSPLTAATAPCTTTAPVVRAAAAPTVGGAEGDSRLQPRVTTKDGDRLPAQALASPTQELKTSSAEVRSAAFRGSILEATRALETFELEEEKAAVDQARLQEATDKAAEMAS